MTGAVGKRADLSDLMYGSEDKPPSGNALLSAITHLLVVFVPTIMPVLIVGGALELPAEMTAYLALMAMVVSGVGTYLQINCFGPVGSGMLSIQSVDFSSATVMIAPDAGMKGGGSTKDAMISMLLGVSLVGAPLVCFSAWFLLYLKKAITPTVSDVVVVLAGLSLVYVGIINFGGGFGVKANGTFGSMENLGLASLVLLVALVFNRMKNPLLRMSGIVVGLIAGYTVVLFLGKVDFSALQNLPLVMLPIPFKYGFALDWHAFIAAGMVFLLSVSGVVGDLTATAMVPDQPIESEEYTKRLRGGVLADGLVSVVATTLGSLPLTTFAQNDGVIQMTGVASRHVSKYIAVILMLLGLFPVVGRAFTTILSLALGGAVVLMFDLIAIAGVRTLVSHGIRRRKVVVAATSVDLGLGMAFESEVFKSLSILFQNSISAGGITTVVLSLLLLEDKSDKVVKVDIDGSEH